MARALAQHGTISLESETDRVGQCRFETRPRLWKRRKSEKTRRTADLNLVRMLPCGYLECDVGVDTQ